MVLEFLVLIEGLPQGLLGALTFLYFRCQLLVDCRKLAGSLDHPLFEFLVQTLDLSLSLFMPRSLDNMPTTAPPCDRELMRPYYIQDFHSSACRERVGAKHRRAGRFEMADGGTIFLDEVGELPSDVQVALLRVLQEREFERVGGTQSVHVDVRVIAATNRDLKTAIAHGAFRQDLFYRLNVFPIEAPPLRERHDDIVMLVEYFVQRYASRAGKSIRSIDKKSVDLLQSYGWPGNIRELQNVIERSVILSSGDVLSVDELWLSRESSQPAHQAGPAASPRSEPRSEREIIEAALAESRGRVSGLSGAAAKLGIPPSTLDHRVKALKISKSQFKFR